MEYGAKATYYVYSIYYTLLFLTLYIFKMKQCVFPPPPSLCDEAFGDGLASGSICAELGRGRVRYVTYSVTLVTCVRGLA